MSHTTVTYKGNVQQRIDMRWLSDFINQTLPIEKVQKLTVSIGNEQVAIGEIFEFSGNAISNENILENACLHMDYIGSKLKPDKKLIVKGECGHYVGARLEGGIVKIQGNTHNFLGCGMTNGLVEVSGNSGNYAGSAMTGEKKGMSGGTILVHGNCGDFTGDLMRRGTIMVVGDIGNHCASRMIAGTITNLGAIGKQVGVGMRRGTLLFPHKPGDMAAGFHDCGRHSLGYLTLLLHELRRHESKFRMLHPMRRRVQRYMGDVSVGGQGELLVWIG